MLVGCCLQSGFDPMEAEKIAGAQHCPGKALQLPADRAAALVGELRGSHVVGRAPGMPRVGAEEDRPAIELALVTVMVWLLAARAGTLAEEEK